MRFCQLRHYLPGDYIGNHSHAYSAMREMKALIIFFGHVLELKRCGNNFGIGGPSNPTCCQQNNFCIINLLRAEIKGTWKRAWEISVSSLLWSIWVHRNDCIFNNSSFNVSSIMCVLKRRALEWCLCANIVSNEQCNLWCYDPGAAVTSFLKRSKSIFLGKAFSKYDLVAFCDGSWHKDNNGQSLGGIGGYVINKNLELTYIFSGPCVAPNAEKAEEIAVLHAIEVLGNLNKEILVCVDSKSIEDLFMKTRAGMDVFSGVDQYFKILVLSYRNIKISYIKREWNFEADYLAKEGKSRERLVAAWL